MNTKVAKIVSVTLMPSSVNGRSMGICVKNIDHYNNSFVSSKIVFGTDLQNIMCPFSLDESWFWKKGERIFFQHHDHCNNELQKL